MAIRYVIAFMILLAKCSIYILRVQMNFSILTMVRTSRSLIHTDKECVENFTSIKIPEDDSNHRSPIQDWSELSSCGILAAYYAGFYSTELFGSYVATFSPKDVIYWFILIPSVVNMLIPVFLTLGGWTIFFMRVIIGMCAGVNLESFPILTMRWAPPGDRILFSGSLYGGILGTICGWIGTAYLGEDVRWDVPFYAFGIFGIILAPFWCILVTDSPVKNRFISTRERIYLEESIAEEIYPELRNVVSIPWRMILKNKLVWILCIFTYGDLWNFYFWLILGPKYLVEVSGFTVKEASLYISLPYISRLISSASATFIWKMYVIYNRHLSVESLTVVRRVFTISSHILPGVLTLCLGGLDLHCHKWYAYTIITIIMIFNGASSESSIANAQDLSTVYGSNIISFVTSFGMTTAVLSTLMLGTLLQHSYTIHSWRIMFFFNGSMYLGSGLLFILFGKGRLQYFHEDTNHAPDMGSMNIQDDVQTRIDTNV